MNILNSFFEWLAVASLRASLLVLAVLAARWLLKNRLPSRWRYALWLPVLAALLLPSLPVLPAWMNWPHPPGSESAASSAILGAGPVVKVKLPASALRADVSAGAEHTSAPSLPVTAALPKPAHWRAWVLGVWMCGVAVAALFVGSSFAFTLRRIRKAALPVDAALRAHIARIAQAIGLRRVPCILKSTAVASPAVCGLWRPSLLLNENFPQDLSGDEADMVLCHELTHIRRGDLAVNALLCALLALHWWNPLLWLAFLRVRADREAACDAQVLEGAPAARRAAYGQTLLKMETEFPPSGLCLGFVGILQRGGTLRDRIHAIITQPKLTYTMKTTIALSIALLTVAGIVTASEEKPEAKTAATKPARAEAQTVFEPVVKAYLTGLSPEEIAGTSGKQYIVTEYEVADLWDKLGIQLFGLSDKSNEDNNDDLDYFAYANGVAKPLKVFTFGGDGIDGAVVADGSLYFTYGAGSGIRRVILYKIGKGKDNALTGESLGTIKSDVSEPEEKVLAEKMSAVIAKLQPVKKGQSTKPAKAGAKATPKQEMDVDKIKDKVRIKRLEEIAVNLKADGERLLPRAPGENAEPDDVAIKIAIKETTATPFRVKGDPTRPYLAMSNGTAKPLHFRTLARLKGSQEFFEVEDAMQPVEPGDMSVVICWESGSDVEEVVLYQFTFAPKTAGTTK